MNKRDILDEKIDLSYFTRYKGKIEGIFRNPNRYERFARTFPIGEGIETNRQLLRVVGTLHPLEISEEAVYETLVNRFQRLPNTGPMIAGVIADYVVDNKLVAKIPTCDED